MINKRISSNYSFCFYRPFVLGVLLFGLLRPCLAFYPSCFISGAVTGCAACVPAHCCCSTTQRAGCEDNTGPGGGFCPLNGTPFGLPCQIGSQYVGDPGCTPSCDQCNSSGFDNCTGAPCIPTVLGGSVSGSVGISFTYNIIASYNPSLYTASSLPPGLLLNPTSGVISGTPSASGVTSVTLLASNAVGTSAPAILVITINPGGPPVVSGGSASGTVGSPFSYTISATNSPLSFATSALPAGLTLSSIILGYIGGIPTATGSTSVTLHATNSYGPSAAATLVITIASGGVPTVANGAASGAVGSSFFYTIAGTNSPTSYSAVGLPPGLSLNSTTGDISGTPTVAGITPVTITASNSIGTSNPATLTITIIASAVPVVAGGTANGTVNSPFTYTITATNSPTSYSSSGLPSGLFLDSSSGIISGIPTIPGITAVILTATNSAGNSLPVTLTITIVAPAPPVITSGNASGTTGTSFTYTISATNTPTSYSASGLPPGLSLNSGTGVISGIPTAMGSYSLSLTATNAGGTSTPAVRIFIINGPCAANTVCGSILSQENSTLAPNIQMLLKDSTDGSITQTAVSGSVAPNYVLTVPVIGRKYFVMPAIDRGQAASPSQTAVVATQQADFLIRGLPTIVNLKTTPGTYVLITSGAYASPTPPSINAATSSKYFTKVAGPDGLATLKILPGVAYTLTCFIPATNNGSISYPKTQSATLINGGAAVAPNQQIPTAGTLSCP